MITDHDPPRGDGHGLPEKSRCGIPMLGGGDDEFVRDIGGWCAIFMPDADYDWSFICWESVWVRLWLFEETQKGRCLVRLQACYTRDLMEMVDPVAKAKRVKVTI